MFDKSDQPDVVINMPNIGEGMTHGTVIEWHKQPGEWVAVGEVVLTIETEKAAYEIEATVSGHIRSLAPVGTEVPVGDVVAVIGGSGTGAKALEPVTDNEQPAAQMPVQSVEQTPIPKAGYLASPKARRLAGEHDIDLASIQPSASDGVITAADVEKVIDRRLTRHEQEARPLSGIRRTSARRVAESWRSIPHIVQMVEVDASAMTSELRGLRVDIPELTLNDLIVRAAALALVDVGEINGSMIDDQSAIYYDSSNIGFAVDTPRGVYAPVIRKVEAMTLDALVRERSRLVQACQSGNLDSADIGNASLTVSNLGKSVVSFGTPIINQGEAVLIFVGALAERPAVRNGIVVARPMLPVSIAYDHRFADGSLAARYSQALKERLEAPSEVGRGVREMAAREVAASNDTGSYCVRLHSARHSWTVDEPADVGGTDLGSDPINALLGALLSCLIISLRLATRRRSLDVGHIRGSVSANLGRLREIAVLLSVDSDAPVVDIERALETAKRSCNVSAALSPEIAQSIQLTVLPIDPRT